MISSYYCNNRLALISQKPVLGFCEVPFTREAGAAHVSITLAEPNSRCALQLLFLPERGGVPHASPVWLYGSKALSSLPGEGGVSWPHPSL